MLFKRAAVASALIWIFHRNSLKKKIFHRPGEEKLWAAIWPWCSHSWPRIFFLFYYYLGRGDARQGEKAITIERLHVKWTLLIIRFPWWRGRKCDEQRPAGRWGKSRPPPMTTGRKSQSSLKWRWRLLLSDHWEVEQNRELQFYTRNRWIPRSAWEQRKIKATPRRRCNEHWGWCSRVRGDRCVRRLPERRSDLTRVLVVFIFPAQHNSNSSRDALGL